MRTTSELREVASGDEIIPLPACVVWQSLENVAQIGYLKCRSRRCSPRRSRKRKIICENLRAFNLRLPRRSRGRSAGNALSYLKVYLTPTPPQLARNPRS